MSINPILGILEKYFLTTLGKYNDRELGNFAC